MKVVVGETDDTDSLKAIKGHMKYWRNILKWIFSGLWKEQARPALWKF